MVKKNENPDFSIIIPVYNCEKYLKRCLDSILAQTFNRYEVILINDGSTDKSGELCDYYANINKRIIVIHKKNAGVSAARNDGLKKATGKYITFLDSDDYIEEDYLEYANKMFGKFDIKLLNTGFFSEVEDENDNKTFDLITAKEKEYKNYDEIKKDLVYLWDTHMLYNIWNKIYINEIIQKNKIEFPAKNFGEDMEFNREYLRYVDKMYNSEKCFYHYIKERKGSITAKYKENLFNIRVKEYYEFNQYFSKNNLKEEEYIEFSSRRFIERVLGCVENICGSELSPKEKKIKLKEIINHKLTKETLKIAKLKTKKIKIMMFPLRIRSTWLLYVMGMTISKIRKANPQLFNKLKNHR